MTDKLIVAWALIFAACYAWMTERVTVLPFGDPLGPRAFPRILTVALLVAVVLLLFEMFFSKDGKKLYWVRVGPEAEQSAATALSAKLKAAGHRDARVVAYP